jgi:hypothetical protein
MTFERIYVSKELIVNGMYKKYVGINKNTI